MTGLLVCAPLGIEARALRATLGPGPVVRTGFGPARSAKSAAELARREFSALVVAGLAGGVGADLHPGDVVAASEVRGRRTVPCSLLPGLWQELLRAGLFLDPDTHQLSRENRARLMEIFQFGHWESVAAVDELHRTRARREQLELLGGAVPSLMSVDNHALHIFEHTRFALGAEFRRLQDEQPALAQALIMHIEGHRALAGNPQTL